MSEEAAAADQNAIALSALSVRLGKVAVAGAAALVPLFYIPPLDAPFLVTKFALLDVAAAVGLVAFALHRVARPNVRLFVRPVAWAIWLVLATTLASWAVAVHAGRPSPYAVAAVGRWGALFALACGAVVVSRDPDGPRAVMEAATLGAGLVAAIGLVQHFDLALLFIPNTSPPGSTFGNRNFGGEAMALSLPLGTALLLSSRGDPGRRRAIGVALLLELFYLAATRTRGAWLGTAVGLAVVLLVGRPRLSRRALAAGLVASVLAAVAGLLPSWRVERHPDDQKRNASGVEVLESSFDPQSPAVYVRKGIWRRSVRMWREHPIWGVGPGNWPIWFPRYAEPDSRRDGALTAFIVARQAHDDLLERGGETGVIGVAALAALAFAVAGVIHRRARTGEGGVPASTAGGAGALAAMVGCGITGFPLEMPGTLTLAGIALGLVAANLGANGEVPATRPRLTGRWTLVALSVASVVAAIAVGQRQIRANYWLGKAIRIMPRDFSGQPEPAALPLLDRARALGPGSYRAWLYTSRAALGEGRAEEAADAARRTLALEPWAPNAWAMLAEAELTAGKPREARDDAARALSILHDFPQALYTTARAQQALGDFGAVNDARAKLNALATEPSPDLRTLYQARSLLLRLDVMGVKPPDR